MKKIIISGSSRLVDKVKYWVNYFQEKGHEILDYPKYLGEANEVANYDEALTKVYKEYYRSLEETGLKVIPLSDSIYGIQALPTEGHVKRNKYISSHTHLDVIYLLEADDKLPLKMKEDENSGVKWIPLADSFSDDIVDFVRPVTEKLVKNYN